jgi:hypothetical protein
VLLEKSRTKDVTAPTLVLLLLLLLPQLWHVPL